MGKYDKIEIQHICLNICSGGTPKSTVTEYYGGNIPWLNTKEINFCRIYETERTITDEGLNNSSAKWVPANTVIVAMYGATAGKTAIAKIPLTTNQACCNLNIDSAKADYRFVYYALYNDYAYLASLANGGAQQNLNAQQIKEFEIPFPPLKEQKRIADILSSLDDKIELNRRINRNLEQQAQALFKAWFVDFEPFKNGKFVDSELGRIPEGWKVGHFTDIVKVSGGGTPRTNNPSFWNGSIPFFTPKDASDIVFTYKTEKHITNLGVSNCNSPIYPAHTVFITARGTIGKIKMAGKPMAMNQSCYALLTKKEKLEPYIYLLSLRLVNIMQKKANGAVFEAITTKDFEENIVIPPNEILTSFIQLVNPLFFQIHHNGLENQNLIILKEALLPRLMSGELNVNTITE